MIKAVFRKEEYYWPNSNYCFADHRWAVLGMAFPYRRPENKSLRTRLPDLFGFGVTLPVPSTRRLS